MVSIQSIRANIAQNYTKMTTAIGNFNGRTVQAITSAKNAVVQKVSNVTSSVFQGISQLFAQVKSFRPFKKKVTPVQPHAPKVSVKQSVQKVFGKIKAVLGKILPSKKQQPKPSRPAPAPAPAAPAPAPVDKLEIPEDVPVAPIAPKKLTRTERLIADAERFTGGLENVRRTSRVPKKS